MIAKNYDNHMYTTNPPATLMDYITTPEEVMQEEIKAHNDELKYEMDFIDYDEIRNKELIKYGQNQRIGQQF